MFNLNDFISDADSNDIEVYFVNSDEYGKCQGIHIDLKKSDEAHLRDQLDVAIRDNFKAIYLHV